MYYKNLLHFLFFTFFAISSDANSQINETCKKFHFKSIAIHGTDEYPKKSPDFCQSEQLPLPLNQLVLSLGQLHQKVATTLGIPSMDLFTEGITLVFSGGPFGPLASYATDPQKIYMGVFPDWSVNANKAIDLNTSIYVHEIGHIILRNSNEKLPKALNDISKTVLFIESFSDLLAFTVTNDIVSKNVDLPSCLAEERVLSKNQTYQNKTGYFDNYFSARHVRKCCKNLMKNIETTANIKLLCGQLDDIYPDTSKIPFDYSPLKPIDLDSSESNIDPHQIGTPLVSFLVHLSEALKIPLNDLYFPLFAKVSSSDKPKSFQCKIPRFSNKEFHFNHSTFSYEQIFGHLRASLSSKQKFLYDKLWNKYGMNKAKTMAELNSLNKAANLAKEYWLDQMNKNASEIFNKSNPCLDALRDPYSKDKTCLPKCSIIKK